MKEITPYLTFDGNCREAMTFYQHCVGGELTVTTFGESDFDSPPGAKDRILHALLTKRSPVLMASDTMPGMPYQQGNNVSLSLACDSDDEVDALYAKLSDGGKQTMPPSDAFWGARFGMLTDRFGINWMLNHDRAS